MQTPCQKVLQSLSFISLSQAEMANGTKLFGIVLENEEGDYSNDDCLKPIGNILSTMKYTGPTYSLPEGFQLDSFIETFNVAE